VIAQRRGLIDANPGWSAQMQLDLAASTLGRSPWPSRAVMAERKGEQGVPAMAARTAARSVSRSPGPARAARDTVAHFREPLLETPLQALQCAARRLCRMRIAPLQPVLR